MFYKLNLNMKMVDYLILLDERIGNVVGKRLMDDVKWFINSHDITWDSGTNVKVAFGLGRAMERARGIEALYMQALFMLFRAKDAYIKDPEEKNHREFSHCWDEFEKLMEAAERWRILNLNY
jgi:hypothetical protein